MMPLYFLAAIAILLHLGFAGARVTLSLHALSLGASPLFVGIVMSLLSLVPMLFSVQWGRQIDRIGVQKPMVVGTLLVIAGVSIGAMTTHVEMLLLVSTITGSGFMLFHLAANQTAGQLGPAEERARNFSVLALAFSTSGFLGPMIAGFSIDWVGHRATFLLLGVAPVATLLLLRWRPIRLPIDHRARAAAGRRDFFDLLRRPAMRRVFVVSGLISMSWDLFSFVMPIHGSRLGLSASVIGLILGTFGAAIFFVRLILPLVLHRVTEWKLLIATMIATAFSIVAIAFVTDTALLLALAFILGMGLGGAQPLVMALLYNYAPPGRGAEAVGMRSLIVNGIAAGIPLVFGALGAALGMVPVFVAMGVALFSGALYARSNDGATSRDPARQ